MIKINKKENKPCMKLRDRYGSHRGQSGDTLTDTGATTVSGGVRQRTRGTAIRTVVSPHYIKRPVTSRRKTG